MAQAVPFIIAGLTAVQAVGNIRESNAQIAAAEEELEITQQRAAEELQEERDASTLRKENIRRETARMKGAQIGLLAKAGVSISEGSALDLLGETAAEGARNEFIEGFESLRTQRSITRTASDVTRLSLGKIEAAKTKRVFGTASILARGVANVGISRLATRTTPTPSAGGTP